MKKNIFMLAKIVVFVESFAFGMAPVRPPVRNLAAFLPDKARAVFAQYAPSFFEQKKNVVGRNITKIDSDVFRQVVSSVGSSRNTDNALIRFALGQQMRHCSTQVAYDRGLQPEDSGQKDPWRLNYRLAVASFGAGFLSCRMLRNYLKDAERKKQLTVHQEDAVLTIFEDRKNLQSVEIKKQLISNLIIQPWDMLDTLKRFDKSDQDIKQLIDQLYDHQTMYRAGGQVVKYAFMYKKYDFAQWYIAQEHDTKRLVKNLLLCDEFKQSELFLQAFAQAFSFDVDEALQNNQYAKIVNLAQQHCNKDVSMFVRRAIDNNNEAFVQRMFEAAQLDVRIDVSSVLNRAIELNRKYLVKEILDDKYIDQHGRVLWRDAGRLDYLFWKAVQLRRDDIIDTLIAHFRKHRDYSYRFTSALRYAIDNHDYITVQKILAEKDGVELYKVEEIFRETSSVKHPIIKHVVKCFINQAYFERSGKQSIIVE